MREDEIEKKILEVIGGKKIPPKTIADKIGEEKEIVKNRLEGMRRDRLVEKTKQGNYYLTDNGAKIIGFVLPVEKAKVKVKETTGFDIKDLIIESRESMLNAFRESVEEIIGEIRKLTITRSSEFRVPGLSEFERVILEEYPRLYVDSIDAVGIPELRRRIKVKLGIDSDVFDELLIKLFESGNGKYKIEEGSGDDGLRFRGRNFMFLKKM